MVDLDAFCEQWGLDASSYELLSSLAPEVQERVVVDFAPKAHTKSVDRLFQGFVRSVGGGPRVARSQETSRLDQAPSLNAEYQEEFAEDDGAAALVDVEEVQGFLSHWELDDNCGSVLLNHSPAVQRRVIDSFAPKPGTRNPSNLFMGFLKSLGSGVPLVGPAVHARAPAHVEEPSFLAEDVSNFALQWDLDDECVAALNTAPPDVVQRIMQDFSPKEGTRNIKSLFMGFLRSISVRAPAAAAGPGYAAGYAAGFGSVASKGGAKGVAKGVAKGGGAPWGAAPAQPRISQWQRQHEIERVGFIEHWGLDHECFQALSQLPMEAQTDTMAKFSPKAGTRDVKGLFMSFLRSMRTPPPGVGFGSKGGYGKGYHVVAPVAPPNGKGYAQVRPGIAQVGPSFGIKRPLAAAYAAPPDAGADMDIGEFIGTWGLDDECYEGLAAMPAEVQTDIMGKFAPKGGTRDVKSLFMGFLRSRASGPMNKQARIS